MIYETRRLDIWSRLFWMVFTPWFVLGFQLNGLASSVIGAMIFDKLFLLAFYGILIASILFRDGLKTSRRLMIFFFCSVFWMFYSFSIKSNVMPAIILDWFSQTKPYLCFLGVVAMKPVLTPQIARWLRWLALFGVAQALAAAATGSVWFYYYHPTNMASIVAVSSLIYYFLSPPGPRTRWITLVLLSVGLLSARSKFYAFYSIAAILLLGKAWMLDFRLRPRQIIAVPILIVLALGAAAEKISYYAQNMRVQDMARPLMILTSGRILVDYFPFGSGFASLGNVASITYYSKIYQEYGLNMVWGLRQDQDFTFAMDTYIPNLTQFGVVGVAIFAVYLLWIRRSIMDLRGNGRLAGTLIVLFLMIDSLADTTILSFRGIFAMLFLGVIFTNQTSQSTEERSSVNNDGGA